MPGQWGCIRMLCIRIQFYLTHWLRCAVYLVLTWWGVADENVYWISYPCIWFWMWWFTADVARCNNNALSELAQRSAAVDGFVFVRISVCISLDNIFCGSFCAGYIRWKDSNSGRTELDLGLVCNMRKGLQPEVCCVVLYYSLLVLLRQDCWSEDRNLSFSAGRMENVFSANCDDFGQRYVCWWCFAFGWSDVILNVGLCYVVILCWGEVFVLISMDDINLVDPASSHTLVSKIKPCMSKYKHFCTVKLRMAHYISYSLLDSTLLLG